MDDHQHKFYLEQYKLLRSEIETIHTKSDNWYKYCLTSTAVVFGWLATQGFGIDSGITTGLCLKIPENAIELISKFPIAINSLSALIVMQSIYKTIKIQQYLKSLENLLTDKQQRWRLHGIQSILPSISTGIIWIALIWGSWIVAEAVLQTAVVVAGYCRK